MSNSEPSPSEAATASLDDDLETITFAAPENPQQIEEFRLLRRIGDGAMGVVYEAEHARLRRRVALKVIKPGCMTPDMLRRFEYEAALLARLEHPGIARIYHAGIWDGRLGPRPYFAMELVDGQKLDDYLQSHRDRYKLRTAVELFYGICQAVQHAHARGVVHRDLKPSNIMVTRDGKPKVLDFGVARAIDADARAAATLHTEPGQLLGTLPYMAPEQAAGRVNELDTASDVYALGVIGYELFSGRMPYSLDDKALHEAVRVICEQEPSRLSSIDRNLRGDVETIVGKALAKEKSRRYATAAELADDVKRYLDSEPITARPPSTWYNLRKFSRRNKALVLGAAATFAVLLAGVIATGTMYLRVEREKRQATDERDSAKATLEFLTNDVFAGATPENLPDEAVRRRIVDAMIMPAARRVGESFKDRPLIEASVRDAIHEVLDKVGRSDLALPHAEAALALRRRVLGPDDPKTISSLNDYAVVLQSLGQLAEAEPIFKEAMERSARVRGESSLETISVTRNYANVLGLRGRTAEAEPLFKRALEVSRTVLGEDHPGTVTSLNSYAFGLQAMGRRKDAEPLFKQALSIHRRALGDDHPNTITSMLNHATTLTHLDRGAEAEPLYKEALDRSRRVLGEDHALTIQALNGYGMMLNAMGRAAEAEPLYKQATQRAGSVLGEDHPVTVLAIGNHGYALFLLGRAGEAEVQFRRAWEQNRRALGEDHPQTIQMTYALARALHALGRVAEAEPLARDALTRALTNPAMGPQHLTSYAKTHANCLAALGRHDEAAAVRKRFNLPDPATQPASSPASRAVG